MKKMLLPIIVLIVLVLSSCTNNLGTDDIFDTLLENVEFLPNSGGQIGPFAAFERTNGLYGMLLVNKVERANYLFTPGDYHEVNMSFTSPVAIGATSYKLEYSSDGSSFQPYQHDAVDLVTPNADTDNFSISPGAAYYYRLVITGGQFDGWYSNVVYAPYTEIDTYWGGYSLDASMTNSDPPVMAPLVGNARVISMTANKLVDNSQVSFTPTYQWYRLNPATYQMTVIDGATATTYTTTESDAGYLLVVRGTGNESTVGGFQQVLDNWGTKIPNKSYAVDVDLDGFYLVLEHEVSNLTKDHFVLYEDDWTTQIPITKITAVSGNPGIYRVDATIPSGESSVYLVSTSAFWTLISHKLETDPWAENLVIDL